jgi:tRNA pseudouridine55 synthase
MVAVYYDSMNAQTESGGWHGLLVLDKPGGMTSRDAVNRIQRQLPRRTRIGHTGTLDPLATGVLVLCLGEATRLAEYVQEMPKTYRARFRLGATSDTDDADGTITPTAAAPPVSREQLDAALARFTGTIEQVPPAYSAAKIAGRRAYDLARGGAEVDLKPRRVTIERLEVLSYEWPRLAVEVRCGKGTYIRALARDLGAALGCGALVEMLRREAVGVFTAAMAPPDGDAAALRAFLRPMIEAVGAMPQVAVSAADAARLRHGQAISGSGLGLTAIVQDGELIGVGNAADDRLHPVKVLAATCSGYN